MEIPDGRGVQVGHHGIQDNKYIQTYIEKQVIQPGPVPAGEVRVVAGDIPQEPPGFQPRADLLAELDAPSPRGRVSVVHAVTGMRGVDKTQLAAAYARARLGEGWRLVAWVNAEDTVAVLGGLAEVTAALGLDARTGDAAAAGRAVRHRLETDGDHCLLVFDNATDPQDLLPFLPAAGRARVLITSNERPVADLGADVAVDVFTQDEALAFPAGRTGSSDTGGAGLLAGELGCLPLAFGPGRRGDRRPAPGLPGLPAAAAGQAGGSTAAADRHRPVPAWAGSGGAALPRCGPGRGWHGGVQRTDDVRRWRAGLRH